MTSKQHDMKTAQTTFPKYYAIKCSMQVDTLQSEAIAKFNEIHGTAYHGYGMYYYGYDGRSERKGTASADHVESFEKPVVVLTPEEFLHLLSSHL